MASQLTKRGYKYRVLPTNDADTFNDFLNDDSEFNIKKLDTDLEKLDDKVLLEGARQQNFDFIENQVVQDGLIHEVYNWNKVTRDITGTISMIVSYEYSIQNMYDMRIGSISGVNDVLSIGCASKYTQYGITNGSNASQIATVSNTHTGNRLVYVEVTTSQIIFIDLITGQQTDVPNTINCEIKTLRTNIGQYDNISTKTINILAYNRPLTPQEIQHNFSVLNNSPSIKELHATDAEGKSSILKLASDTDHVEDRAGRTQEQINRTFYKRNCKEFTSTDGSPITVQNGEEGYVLNAEIKGQTVKNHALIGGKRLDLRYQNTSEVIILNKAETKKKLLFKITRNDTSNSVSPYIQFNDSSTTPITKVGDDFTATLGENWTDIKIRYTALGGTSATYVDIAEITIVDDLNFENTLPLGLSSTQAIINNNGQSYPIYEPIITGKTRILKAPKGTQNWVEISPDEVRDTTKFDYKLDSINGDLGSVGSVSDYVDRASGIISLNTLKFLSLWDKSWSVKQTNTNTIGFVTNIENVGVTPSDASAYMSNLFNVAYNRDDNEHFFIEGNSKLEVYVAKSKLSTQDVAGFLTYIKNNSFGVIAKSRSLQEIQLTKKQLLAYNAYKKVILCGKVGDVADTVTLNEDGRIRVESKTKEIVLNGSEKWLGYTNLGEVSRMYCTNYKETAMKEVLCDKFIHLANYSSNTEHIYMSGDGLCVFISNNKLISQDATGFKTWLQSNPTTVRYQLASPIITHIPKELVPTILTQQTNILEVGGAVKPSSFSITVPTTDGIKKEYILTPINGWTGTAKANLLQTGDIGLALDLTIPEQFNTLITNLPNELKPKTERTVLGYNGNTPVVVKIGADGTVKLPVTATGVVKLDDTYKL